MKPIYCIGTSHVTIFSGHNKESQGFPNIHGDLLPEFRTAHLDSFLAYNLGIPKHQVHAVIEKVLKEISPNSWLLFMFGEVDCRAHILKHLGEWGGSIDRATEHAVDKYMSGVLPYRDRGYQIIMWGPHPIYKANEIWKAAGSWEKIIEVTERYNHYLKVLSDNAGIMYRSIFKWMMDTECYLYGRYYTDPTHISIECLPQIYKEMADILEQL
jgi:hypothetical protein